MSVLDKFITRQNSVHPDLLVWVYKLGDGSLFRINLYAKGNYRGDGTSTFEVDRYVDNSLSLTIPYVTLEELEKLVEQWEAEYFLSHL